MYVAKRRTPWPAGYSRTLRVDDERKVDDDDYNNEYDINQFSSVDQGEGSFYPFPLVVLDYQFYFLRGSSKE